MILAVPARFPAISYWLTLLLLVMFANARADSLLVRHSALSDRDTPSGLEQYYVDLLELALEKTRHDFGPWQRLPLDEHISQARGLEMLANNHSIDVLWGMTNKQREQRVLPVRIPLFKGLMGYRLLLVREQDAALFSEMRSLADLRQLVAGQAHDWADVAILRDNNLPVITASRYLSLFPMLKLGRYDYFPRGVTEAHTELAVHNPGGLTVAPQVALHYPTAMHFFVSPANPALAERLETGLRRALHDGSFDQLLFNHPGTGPGLAQAKLEQRHIIPLDNPNLPQSTPLDEALLWYQRD